MKTENIRIIPYDDRYRDDMIFMILAAKDAMGYIPHLNEDLLDIQTNYIAKGDMFWLALSEDDRVIGTLGFHTLEDPEEVCLHRFYVRADLKGQGIGTKLYDHAEAYLRRIGKTVIRAHLGYSRSRSFYTKRGFTPDTDEDHVVRRL